MAAKRLGHNGARYLAEVVPVWVDFMRHGDLDRVVAKGRRGAEAWKPSGPWSHVGTLLESIGLFLKGEWDRAAEVYAPAIRDFPDDNQWTGGFSGWELLLHAYQGTGAALELFRNREDRIPGVEATAVAGERYLALIAIEALAVIGSLETAAALYPLALETVEGGFVAGFSGLT